MDQFSSLVAILIAISLATERIVTVVKTIFPRFLGEERVDANGVVNSMQDCNRKLIVQAITFIFAWLTSACLTGGAINFFGWMTVGSGDQALKVHVVVVALLSMGGSAFWNNILGYTKAVKEIKVNEKMERETGSTSAQYNWRKSRTEKDTSAVVDRFKALAPPSLKQFTTSRIPQ